MPMCCLYDSYSEGEAKRSFRLPCKPHALTTRVFLQGHGNEDIRASNYRFALGAIRNTQVLHEVNW